MEDFQKHVEDMLDISSDDVIQYIQSSKILQNFCNILEISASASEDTPSEGSNIKSNQPKSIQHKTVSQKPKSTFTYKGHPSRQELVFCDWFERIGDERNYEFCRRFIEGESKGRTNLSGYLDRAGIKDPETFTMLFNILIGDLEYNG